MALSRPDLLSLQRREEPWIFIGRLQFFTLLEASCNRPIFIGRPRPFVIGGTTRSPDFHRTAAIIRDLGDARGAITIGGSPSHSIHKTSSIVRSGSLNLPDLHRTANGGPARTTIVVRSCPDRSAIGIPKRRNQGHEPSHGFGRRSFEHQAHDRGPNVARSWPDRGFFLKQN